LEPRQTLITAMTEWGFHPHECERGVTVSMRVADERVVAITVPSRVGFEVRMVVREPIPERRRFQARMILRALEVHAQVDRDGRLTGQRTAIDVGSWLATVGRVSEDIRNALETLYEQGLVATATPMLARRVSPPSPRDALTR
jgi:hypothetical protein